MSERRTAQRDRGFTLVELLVAVLLTATLLTVIGMAVVTSLRTIPSTSNRADSAVAVQGITTWLPPDVDATQPGAFDVTSGKASGCTGTDPGNNIVHLSWTETFAGVTTTYVANYRFVIDSGTGHIVRVACSGQVALGSPSIMSMSSDLAPTPPTVTKLDTDGDTLTDQVKISITTLSGEVVFINAATKNPHETLPPVVTTPTTTAVSTTTTSTTTTIAPNLPPVAAPVVLTLQPGVPTAVNLPVSDPNGDPLTAVINGLPAGWSAPVSGTLVTITPTAPAGISVFGYTVTDSHGTSASSTITVTVSSTATTTTSTTSTTTTTTTTIPATTTTSVPPCVVSSMTVSPSTVQLTANGSGKLKRDVAVAITVAGGYCVGLTLQYVTGAPNGQYVQNFGTSPPYTVTLLGHPHGTELWAPGVRALNVRDGNGNLLISRNLTVTN